MADKDDLKAIRLVVTEYLEVNDPLGNMNAFVTLCIRWCMQAGHYNGQYEFYTTP